MLETIRLHLRDELIPSADATIIHVRDDEIVVDKSPFYPGGGGQPSDEGEVCFANGETLKIMSAFSDDEGIIWHKLASKAPRDVTGQTVRLSIDQGRRLALTRYHTVLYILNTLALREYDAWITGVQIGVDYSRIDFKFENFSPETVSALEGKVHTVLSESHTIKAFFISETEFATRPDLLRTLTVRPPVHNHQVRVVDIAGFDAQACGGTHVHNTNELGRFSIVRTDNKGRFNKRLYIRLD